MRLEITMSALVIERLHKTYKGGQVALRGIDLIVQQGDFFALLGPNGAGKSTTIGVISSLVNKSSGQVKIFGHDIDQDWAAAKRNLGVVPQEFNFSIFEKVFDIVANQGGYYGIPRPEAKAQAEHCLKEVGLWDKRQQPAQRLSGGMKRRLMIARALVHKPKLLILDEPTAGVDIEIRRSMWDFLRKINQAGTTIILTTHYLEEAENLCKNIAIINNGEIVEHTDMKSLLQRMQVQSFIMDLAKPLYEPSDLAGIKCVKIDSHCIEIELPHGRTLNELFELLGHHGIEVSSMRNKSNRLEELFLNLTHGQGSNEP